MLTISRINHRATTINAPTTTGTSTSTNISTSNKTVPTTLSSLNLSIAGSYNKIDTSTTSKPGESINLVRNDGVHSKTLYDDVTNTKSALFGVVETKPTLMTENTTISTPPQSSSSSTTTTIGGSRMNVNIAPYEKQYNDALLVRDTLRKELDGHEAELSKLLVKVKSITGNAGSNRPRESVDEIDEQIQKLERKRETNSMSLASEREILKDIYKLKKARTVAEEYSIYDGKIKLIKETIASIRQRLREDVATQVSLTKVQLDNAKLASELGCDITELVGRKIDCPVDKLAQVIGKKGKNIKDLEMNAKVDVNFAKSTSAATTSTTNSDDTTSNSNKKNGTHGSKNSLNGSSNTPASGDGGDGNKTAKELYIVGTMESLVKAVSNFDQMISKTEVTITVPEKLVLYLTTKQITALSEIRSKDPTTYCNVVRDKKTEITIRGQPANIETMKEDFMSLSKKLKMQLIQAPSKDASKYIVGKNGAIIDALVAKYQVAIDVTRAEDDDDHIDNDVDVQTEKNNKDTNSDKNTPTEASPGVGTKSSTTASSYNTSMTDITLIGDSTDVDELHQLIESILEKNREVTTPVPTDRYVRAALFAKNGHGVHLLQKHVNDSINNMNDNSIGSNAVVVVVDNGQQQQQQQREKFHVGISLNDDGVVVKGKRDILPLAAAFVQVEVHRIAAMTTMIKVDPVIIPTLIGKGGEGIKQLKNGIDTVVITIDRSAGTIVLAGTEMNDIQKVACSINGAIENNQIRRIPLGTNTVEFHEQFRELMRSKGNKLRELVFLLSEDEKAQLVIRGTTENLKKAQEIIDAFIESLYFEELEVTADDMKALLTGGKQSKIVEFSNSTSVKLNSVRERNVIIAKGTKSNVTTALKTIRAFLYGGEGTAVTTIPLEKEYMGLIIGREGKSKKELEAKFPTVSILTPRGNTETGLTLRGPEKDVAACTLEIQKIILTARVTRTYAVPVPKVDHRKQSQQPQKQQKNQPSQREPEKEPSMKEVVINQQTLRQLFQKEFVTVQMEISSYNNVITVRGTLDNVQVAMTLLKEHYEDGAYESFISLGGPLFQKVKEKCPDPSNWKSIETETQCTITLEEKRGDIVVVAAKRENVKFAKKKLLGILELVFGNAQFTSVNLSSSEELSTISKMSVDVAIESGGARIIVDRDLMSVLIFGIPNGATGACSTTQKASEIIKSKLANGMAFVHEFSFDTKEDRLLATLIGKKGVNIKKIRKECLPCAIIVNSEERKVTIKAKTADTLAKGKATLEEHFDQLRGLTVLVPIPAIGTDGSNITEFSQKLVGVDVHMVNDTKKSPSLSSSASLLVRISGTDSRQVAAAKDALMEWISAQNHPLAETDVDQALPAAPVDTVLASDNNVSTEEQIQSDNNISTAEQVPLIKVTKDDDDDAVPTVPPSPETFVESTKLQNIVTSSTEIGTEADCCTLLAKRVTTDDEDEDDMCGYGEPSPSSSKSTPRTVVSNPSWASSADHTNPLSAATSSSTQSSIAANSAAGDDDDEHEHLEGDHNDDGSDNDKHVIIMMKNSHDHDTINVVLDQPAQREPDDTNVHNVDTVKDDTEDHVTSCTNSSVVSLIFDEEEKEHKIEHAQQHEQVEDNINTMKEDNEDCTKVESVQDALYETNLDTKDSEDLTKEEEITDEHEMKENIDAVAVMEPPIQNKLEDTNINNESGTMTDENQMTEHHDVVEIARDQAAQDEPAGNILDTNKDDNEYQLKEHQSKENGESMIDSSGILSSELQSVAVKDSHCNIDNTGVIEEPVVSTVSDEVVANTVEYYVGDIVDVTETEE